MEPIVEVKREDLAYLVKLADWAAGQGFCQIEGIEDPEDWCCETWGNYGPENGDGYSAEALAAALSTPSPALKADNAALEQWRHKKRGTVYEKIGVAELQCATGLNPGEGDGLVIYRGEDGKLWARMADEFHDGRFEAVQAANHHRSDDHAQ